MARHLRRGRGELRRFVAPHALPDTCAARSVRAGASLTTLCGGSGYGLPDPRVPEERTVGPGPIHLATPSLQRSQPSIIVAPRPHEVEGAPREQDRRRQVELRITFTQNEQPEEPREHEPFHPLARDVTLVHDLAKARKKTGKRRREVLQRPPAARGPWLPPAVAFGPTRSPVGALRRHTWHRIQATRTAA